MASVGQFVFSVLTLFAACVLGVQYDLYKEESTWYEARAACSRDNKRLVHVTEEAEHTRIQHYSPYIFQHFWIGLRGENSQFQWTDNSVARFTAWGQGQPNDQSACVRYSATDFTWETHNCSALLFFMCENDVPPTKTSGGETRATGLLIGFGTMLAILLLGILLLQLPCCRSNTVKVIGQFGLGTR